MAPEGDLREGLYRKIRDSGRAWTAEEIARSALRIVSDPERAESLVGAILGGDARFARGEEGWTAVLRPPEPALAGHEFLLVDVGRATGPGGPIPLFLQPYDGGSVAAGEIVPIAPDGAGLERSGDLLERRLPVSLSAGPARRQLHRLERTHGIPSASERVVDLASLLALLDLPLPGTIGPESAASPEERLHACRETLALVIERAGGETISSLEERVERSRPGEPVDFSRFRFGRERIEAVPERPGVYRFLGEEVRVLYVGKSRNLRRRVTEYFRPLAPDHGRRARLLAEVRDLAWETAPSELEALLIEAEEIRRLRPAHNRQIEIAPGEPQPPPSSADAGFVLCEGDPGEASLVLLREGKPWARGRLPRDPGAGGLQRIERIVAAWRGGAGASEAGLARIEEADAPLVLRYLRIYGDRTDRILRDGPSDADLAAALLALATRERSDDDRWWFRSGK